MNPRRLNHFIHVANAMNSYVAASSRSYYHPYSRYLADRHVLAMYQRPRLMNSGLGGLFAYGLRSIGMPHGVVNFGYRVGRFVDVYS